MAGGGVERIGAVFRGTIAKPWRIPRKQGQLGCFLDQPVAEIVQCGEPAFARLRRASARLASQSPFQGELRFNRRASASEGCLAEAPKGRRRTPSGEPLGFAELRLGRRVPVISELGRGSESPLAKSVPP